MEAVSTVNILVQETVGLWEYCRTAFVEKIPEGNQNFNFSASALTQFFTGLSLTNFGPESGYSGLFSFFLP